MSYVSEKSGSGVSPLRQSRDGSATLSFRQKPKSILFARHEMLKVAEASRLRMKQRQSGSGVSPLRQSRDGSATLLTNL